jgi:hypothetical protein
VGVLLYLVVVASVLFFVAWIVPRRARIEEGPTRLLIRRPLGARLALDLRLFLGGGLIVYLLVYFASTREWVAAGICAVILLRVLWMVRRNVGRGEILLDRDEDRLSADGRSLGKASAVVSVEIGARNPEIVLALREGAQPDRGVVLSMTDRTDARVVGAAIARFLRVAVFEAPEPSRG